MQWERPQLPNIPVGDSVSDVEAAAGMVSASFNGEPTAIATSPVHLDDWTLSHTMPAGAGPVPSEHIVLQGKVGWLVEVDRTVLGGARLIDGAWVPWNPPCSQAEGPALLAASDPTHLVAVCHEGLYTSGTPVVNAYFSSDGGSTFQPAATSPPSFPPDDTGIASPAPDVVIMGGNAGDLIGTFDGGTTWTVVHHQPDSASWLQVGFTTSTQGVAIDESGNLLMTFDGGHDWIPVDFSAVQQ
ncbi:MAG TPA: hypothetical protein VHU17_06825 [Acidimicrobiales bacterium]|nr:hypothetical protein [Acidimicrobiales bacterium]